MISKILCALCASLSVFSAVSAALPEDKPGGGVVVERTPGYDLVQAVSTADSLNSYPYGPYGPVVYGFDMSRHPANSVHVGVTSATTNPNLLAVAGLTGLGIDATSGAVVNAEGGAVGQVSRDGRVYDLYGEYVGNVAADPMTGQVVFQAIGG